MYQTIKVEREDRVAILTFNRPEKMNALSQQMIHEVVDAIQTFNEEKNVGAILVTAEGKSFCAGADLAEMGEVDTPAGALKLLHNAHRLQFAVEESPKATVCCINGLAMGGGMELSLAFDIRIASSAAVFALPEINTGLLPGSGGMSRLTQLIGVGRAKELVLTGRKVSAEEALTIGLVNQVADSGELLAKGLEMAQSLASKPPLGIKLAKETISSNLGVDYRTGLGNEARTFGLLFSSKDRLEGVTAFLEKRKPVFTGE